MARKVTRETAKPPRKKVKPSPAAKPRSSIASVKAPLSQRPMPGELLTLMDFVRYAVSRFNAAELVFAHGTTDPVAEAAFIVGEMLHLDPGRFETFAGA